MELILQLLFGVLTVASGIVTTIWGFKSVARLVRELRVEMHAELAKLRGEMHVALEGKIDRATYAAKTKELHDVNNDLARRLAVQETETKNLREMVEFLKERAK